MESLDYDIDASSLYEQDLLRQPPWIRRNYVVFGWMVCCLTGSLTGAVAFVLDVSAQGRTWRTPTPCAFH